ncbi:coagulation factor X-like [Drosophila biarmipes]|uniref:coagulation factor X-like n=1 Tax=Drosophila biarmipes TaxID=125945 RepID=UPI0007E68F73|nr:coagulation factor X-like [Drosophila biarmipes]
MGSPLWLAFCTLLLFYKGSAKFLERNCGRSQSIHIPNPWLVTIRNKANSEFICAGTLLNERSILTAASCIKRGTNLIVRLGERNLNGTYEESIVAKAIVHRSPEQNDIALLRLKTSVVYKTEIQPICINANVEKTPIASTYEIGRKYQKKPDVVECPWHRKLLFLFGLGNPCPSQKEEVNLSPDPIERGSPDNRYKDELFFQKGILTNKDIYTDVEAYVDWIIPNALQIDIIWAPELPSP